MSSTVPERFLGVFGQGAPNFGSVPTGAPINVGNGSTLQAASAASIATGLSSVVGSFSGPPTPASLLAAQSAPVNNDSNPGRVAAMTEMPIWRSKEFSQSYFNDSFVFRFGDHTVTLDIANAIMYGSTIGSLARGNIAPSASAISWNMFDEDLGGASSSQKVSIDTTGARFMGENSISATSVYEADMNIMPLGTIHAAERQRMQKRPTTAPAFCTVHMQGLLKCVDYWELMRKIPCMGLYFVIKPLASPYRASAPLGQVDARTEDIAAQLNYPKTPQMVPYLGAQLDGVVREGPMRNGYLYDINSEGPNYLSEWRHLDAEYSEIKRLTHGIFEGMDGDRPIYRTGDELDADEYLITNYAPAAVKPAGIYHDGLSPLEYDDFVDTVFEPSRSGVTAALPFNGSLASHAPRIRIVRNGHY